jgi:uncharacterized protein YhaN
MNRVIEQNLTQENEKVLENLDSSFVKQPLVEITKHYVSLDLRDDAIVAIDEDNQEFALSTLSTGAREQIMLALRIGFAKQVLQGDTGFLILDDAFQHSDWQRRPRLVDAVLQMAQQGWQVIYFAMDDHIRGLFDARAKKLPKNRYKRIDL